jgi:hypothetical protein
MLRRSAGKGQARLPCWRERPSEAQGERTGTPRCRSLTGNWLKDRTGKITGCDLAIGLCPEMTEYGTSCGTDRLRLHRCRPPAGRGVLIPRLRNGRRTIIIRGTAGPNWPWRFWRPPALPDVSWRHRGHHTQEVSPTNTSHAAGAGTPGMPSDTRAAISANGPATPRPRAPLPVIPVEIVPAVMASRAGSASRPRRPTAAAGAAANS